jgi:hypothetical protein
MAYRLKPGKQARKELARIVSKEFERVLEALASLPPRGAAVYEARKHVKKIRAVLRLLQTSLGKDYRRHNTRLRDLSHELATIRDADALIESMKGVRAHYPSIVTAAALAGSAVDSRPGSAARWRRCPIDAGTSCCASCAVPPRYCRRACIRRRTVPRSAPG